jgi:hypothetical protein
MEMTMATAAPAIAAPKQTLSDDACDLCCATPVRTVLDGDKVCQSCADKWARSEADYYGHAPDADEIAVLERSLQRAGVYRGALIEARLTDAQLVRMSADQRRFSRSAVA